MHQGTARHAGFTLLELMTVIIITLILLTMAVPGFSYLRGRAEGVNCRSNLRALYTAASAYTTEKGSWPQVSTRGTSQPPYAQAWNAALRDYGISEKNWLCPTVHRMMKSPDMSDPKNARVDYLPTPFGTGARTPYKYATHPWFMERGDVHGDGNLIILASGEVKSLREVLRDAPRGEWQQ